MKNPFYIFLCSRLINFADTMSEWYGHPLVLGIPISKTINGRLVIWASLLTLILTLTQIAKVVWEGDALMTRVLGMGMLKTRECPYHCDNDYSRSLGQATNPFRQTNWKEPANDTGNAHAILTQRQWRKFQLTGLYLLVMTSNLLTRLMKTCNA